MSSSSVLIEQNQAISTQESKLQQEISTFKFKNGRPLHATYNGLPESPGDLYKGFKLFKQKCELIFDGLLDKLPDGKKVRHLLLWIGNKGLEIYNTATWSDDVDSFKLEPVFDLLEAYTKPKSNHILARFQLRSLKQNDMSLEEFVTKTKRLFDEGGYHQDFKDETLRDNLVFGLNSDKVRKDAIALGNKLI
jgi:hypothetical protein